MKLLRAISRLVCDCFATKKQRPDKNIFPPSPPRENNKTITEFRGEEKELTNIKFKVPTVILEETTPNSGHSQPVRHSTAFSEKVYDDDVYRHYDEQRKIRFSMSPDDNVRSTPSSLNLDSRESPRFIQEECSIEKEPKQGPRTEEMTIYVSNKDNDGALEESPNSDSGFDLDFDNDSVESSESESDSQASKSAHIVDKTFQAECGKDAQIGSFCSAWEKASRAAEDREISLFNSKLYRIMNDCGSVGDSKARQQLTRPRTAPAVAAGKLPTIYVDP